jgi:hypothetical protein
MIISTETAQALWSSLFRKRGLMSNLGSDFAILTQCERIRTRDGRAGLLTLSRESRREFATSRAPSQSRFRSSVAARRIVESMSSCMARISRTQPPLNGTQLSSNRRKKRIVRLCRSWSSAHSACLLHRRTKASLGGPEERHRRIVAARLGRGPENSWVVRKHKKWPPSV